MKRLLPLLIVLSGSAAVAADAITAESLAGRYSRSVRSGDVSGARYTVTDTAIIVPTGPASAYVELELNFFNAHMCSIGGMAALEDRLLIYREAEDPAFDGRPCELSLWRERSRLRWSDGGGSCQAFCGARGTLSEGEMRWSSRRAIPSAEQRRILEEYERVRNLP